MDQSRRHVSLRSRGFLPLVVAAVSALAFLVPATLSASGAVAAPAVGQPPVFTSAATVTFLIGVPSGFYVTAAGSPAPTFSETGALPFGVALTADGILAGTPGVGSGGAYPITFTATNTAGTATQAFTLIVPQPPAAAVGVEGSDGQMWVQAPQLPGGWQPEGGRIIGAPAVAAPPSPNAGTLAAPVFIATGTDDRLYIRSLTEGWQLLSPVFPANCLNGPAAVIVGTTLTVACEGTDHALWENTATVPSSGLPQVTGPWTALGGVLGDGPAVALVGGAMTFFAPGTNDGQIWTRTLSTGFVPQPWHCIGRPAAAVQPPWGNAINSWFACEGTDHGLWEDENSGGGWSGAVKLGIGIPLTGSPPAFAGNLSGPALFYEATGTAIWALGVHGTGQLFGDVVGGVGATALD